MDLPPGFDHDGRPQTTAAAKEAIERIMIGRGYIDAFGESELRKNDLRWQDHVRSLAKGLRESLGTLTKTVAEQLYSSKFRFIHELLQNADDARYAENVEPNLKFQIRQGKVIVELNELGFTLSDVEAICQTGKSSKTGDESTTGEKGFGFKSVFGIADSVSIQSGCWSFRFEHKEGDDGVGMVTPIWTESNGSPLSGTRYTLRLSDKTEQFVNQMMDEFEKLQNTTIFALRQISKLEVAFHNVYGRAGSITFCREGELSSANLRITTAVSGTFGAHVSHTAHFKPYQKMILNLAGKEKLRPYDQTTVSIAFEVDEDGVPLVPARGQHVFAYLPIQRLPQLPFIIHADFVLAASRETVPDNDWNRALLEGVAGAFVDAVWRFSSVRGPLAYTWMRYWPSKNMEGIWERLHDECTSGIREVSILWTYSNYLRPIDHVRRLPRWFFHDGKPIVPDTPKDVYLSESYAAADVRILEKLGVKMLSKSMIVDRIRRKISSPDIRSKPLDDDWHTAFVDALAVLSDDQPSWESIKHMNVLPLYDGEWVSPHSQASVPVYHPFAVDEGTVQIRIPKGLGLTILHPTASAVGSRMAFYQSIGITSCPPKKIIDKILRFHQTNGSGRSVPAEEWLADLEILFWYNADLPQRPLAPIRRYLAVNTRNQVLITDMLFFASEEWCNAKSLLSMTSVDDYKGYGFLGELYCTSKVRHQIRNKYNWISWLQACGVTYHIPLTEEFFISRILHPLLKLVARDNPDVFVANLKEHWLIYQHEAKYISNTLQNLPVWCMGAKLYPLKNTVLPTKAVMDKTHDLHVQDWIPLLKLPQRYGTPTIEEWSFLGQFGVILDVDDIAFYLAALRGLQESGQDTSDLTDIASAIYAGIGTCSQIKDKPKLRLAFDEEPLIYFRSDDGLNWRKLTECAWNGPSCLLTKQTLCYIYGKDESTTAFFKTFIGLGDVTHEDLLGELRHMASNPLPTGQNLDEKLQEVYTALADMCQDHQVKTEIKASFDNTDLIYAGGLWRKPGTCLWNCTVEISGKVPLDSQYPRLRKFFVDALLVDTMNATSLVQELTRISRRDDPNIDEVRRIILAVGRILAADVEASIAPKALRALKEAPFLPVCDGDHRALRKCTEPFYVNDHQRYGEAFRNKAPALDFEHADMTSLHPLFKVLDLEMRYLSSRVEASTTVGDSQLSNDLTEHLRSLAFPLSCCAITQNSPRYLNQNMATHNKLLAAEVYVCEDMGTELQLNDGGLCVSARSDRAVVKIDEGADGFRLYVPSDHDGLYSCYCTELPGELARVLGISNRGAVKTIYRILNDQVRDVNSIMQDEDLAEYPWIHKPSCLVRAPVPAALLDRGDAGEPHLPTEMSDDAESDSGAPNSIGAIGTHPGSSHGLVSNQPGTVFEPVWRRVARDELYAKLLDGVAQQARHVTDDGFSLHSIRNVVDEMRGLTRDSDFTACLDNQRIGAAGELFIYERLLALGVENFSITNWQSNIRHHVCVHRDYRDIGGWSAREKADIMYEGSCPRLIQFLLETAESNPYPPFLDNRLLRPVKFHLEVKTSVGPCDTPFFVSQYQYNLMQRIACDSDETSAPTDLYVLLRVFNILSDRICVKAYINPWHLRDDRLQFMADPWKVVAY